LVVGAGPMFFSDPRVEATHEKQALFKAEAMAESLRDLGLTAWAPGANDWAMGVERMAALTKETGARALAANLGENAGPVSATHVVKIGDLKVGLVGISVPQVLGVELGFPVGDASVALKRAISAVKGEGAQIVVL